MCNDYESHIAYSQYTALMEQLDIGLPAYEGEDPMPFADDIRIGQGGAVAVPEGNGARIVRATFGKPQPGKGPLFNFRSEGRHFADSPRCIVPASAFFEFTGEKSPKTKHRFVLQGAPIMGIAGRYWPEENAFAMLTTSPGPDVSPYHDRQIVILRPELWADWLFLQPGNEGQLLKHLPAGALAHSVVRVGKGEEHLYQVG
jgi:putative SOS response-associated peptidase YedK